MTDPELGALIAWFMRTVARDIPSSLYGCGSAEVIVRGGSVTHDDAMVAWASRHPFSVDEDGYYRRPASAAIAAIGSRRPKRARYLRSLSQSGDWETLGLQAGRVDREARAYAVIAIRDFHLSYRARPYTGFNHDADAGLTVRR